VKNLIFRFINTRLIRVCAAKTVAYYFQRSFDEFLQRVAGFAAQTGGVNRHLIDYFDCRASVFFVSKAENHC